jgi:hypothetical protein
VYGADEELCTRILTLLVGLLHRAFRKDVFRSIQDLVHPDEAAAALEGRVALSLDALADVLQGGAGPIGSVHELPGLCLYYPDRTKVRSLLGLVNLLWDLDDGTTRGRWEQYAYRVLYRRARALVRLHVGQSYEAKLHEFLKRQFVLTHWILPFPNTQRFWRPAEGKRRAYVAVRHHVAQYEDAVGMFDLAPWAELQQLNRVHEEAEKAAAWWRSPGPDERDEGDEAWMPAWALASNSRLYDDDARRARPLRGIPCEAPEVQADLYGPWEEFAARLEEDFNL